MTPQEFDKRLDEIMFIFAQEFVNNPSLDAKEKAKQAIKELFVEVIGKDSPVKTRQTGTRSYLALGSNLEKERIRTTITGKEGGE